MSIKDLFQKKPAQDKKTYPISPTEINSKFGECEDDTRKRIIDYRRYDRFFKGEQWWRNEMSRYDGHPYTNNLCRPTCEKYAALLGGTPPEIHVPPEYEHRAEYDIYKVIAGNYETEMNRSEAVEKEFRKILYEDNTWAKTLYQGSLGGSCFGDTVFYHPWDSKKKKFKIQNIFPGYFRAKFQSTDYEEMEYAFIVEIKSVESIEREYGVRVREAEVAHFRDSIWDDTRLRSGGYAIVKRYYDHDYYAVVCDDIFLKEPVKHGLPRIPFTHIPNRWDCFESWGASDLVDLVPMQEEFNVACSDEAKIVKLFSNPKIVGKNLTTKDINYLKKNKGTLWALRKDGDLKPFQFTGNIYPISQRIQDILQRWYMISGLTPVFWGSVQGSIVTGVAMTGQASPTLQTVRAKTEMWNDKLISMFAFMLETLEKYGGTGEGNKLSYKKIIKGNYNMEIQWENRMPRDDSIYIANELQKQAARTQSRFTTMKRLGVKSPQDEMALIAWQERHPLLMSPESEIQHKVLNNQHRWEGLEDALKVASEENVKMARGMADEVTEKSADENIAHAEAHISYIKEHEAAGMQIPQAIKQIFDEHIATHEERAQKEGGASKSVTQAMAGQPQPGFEGPQPIPETTAGAPITQEMTGQPSAPGVPGQGGIPGIPNIPGQSTE